MFARGSTDEAHDLREVLRAERERFHRLRRVAHSLAVRLVSKTKGMCPPELHAGGECSDCDALNALAVLMEEEGL